MLMPTNFLSILVQVLSIMTISFLLPALPPSIDVKTSTFADDWLKMLHDRHHTDVTFLLNESNRLEAHRVMIAASSTFFRKVTQVNMIPKVKTFVSIMWVIFF